MSEEKEQEKDCAMAPEINQLASWIMGFQTKQPPVEAIDQAKCLLLDSLGCALAALDKKSIMLALKVVADVDGSKQSRIIGSRQRTSAPMAVFANSALIRSLDLNDYFGTTKVAGHPSDNIAVALSIGDWQRSTGLDVLKSIIMGYELYGRLQDKIEPQGAWDHTTASGIVAPAMAGFLMNLDDEYLTHALALGATYCPALAVLRHGKLSAAKGLANATVAQGAVFQTLLAAEGITGPLGVLDGKNGLNSVVLSHGGISDTMLSTENHYRIMDANVKPYPCVGSSQSLVAAALRIYPFIAKRQNEIDKIVITMADLPMVVTQRDDPLRRHPNSRETADHSFYFLTAVALLDGELTTLQFDNHRWEDPQVLAISDRIIIRTDSALNTSATKSFAIDLRVLMADGSEHRAEFLYHPGHNQDRLDTKGIAAKFSKYNGLSHPRINWNELVKAVDALDDSPNLDALFQIVCP